MTIAVVGSRGFNDYTFFEDKIRWFIQNIKEEVSFVSGGAKSGADNLIERFCKENGYKIKIHLPDWELHGKKAGFLRNKQIIDDADGCIAFWDGKSKGTKHSIDLAHKKEIPIKIMKI